METDAYTTGNRMTSDEGSFCEKIQAAFEMLTSQEKIAYIKGYFDTHGRVIKTIPAVQCVIYSSEVKWLEAIQTFIGIPGTFYPGCLNYSGVNAIEFLHHLYHDSDCVDYNHNYASYRDLLYPWRPSTKLYGVIKLASNGAQLCYPGDGMVFKYAKTLDNAVKPTKAHVTDTGYDLHLVKKVKEENGMVMYDTGIAVQPPFGFYFDLVGRSSISKTGYIVANSVGIIDASYTGSIKVALIKVNKDAPDLELPAKLVQLIPRQLIHFDAQEVPDLDETQRAEGGFGSSGK